MSGYLHLRSLSSGRACRFRAGFSRASAIVLLGAMSTVVAALGLPTGAASASTAPRTSTFCGFAANEAKGTSVSPATTPGSLEAEFTKLKSEESFVLSASPSQLKGDFTTIFTYLNKFISVLASVKYDFAKLSLAQEKEFATADTKQVTAAVSAIKVYLKNVCHVTSA